MMVSGRKAGFFGDAALGGRPGCSRCSSPMHIQTAQSRLGVGGCLEIDYGKSRGKSSGRNRKEQEGREWGRFDGNTL